MRVWWRLSKIWEKGHGKEAADVEPDALAAAATEAAAAGATELRYMSRTRQTRARTPQRTHGRAAGGRHAGTEICTGAAMTGVATTGFCTARNAGAYAPLGISRMSGSSRPSSLKYS